MLVLDLQGEYHQLNIGHNSIWTKTYTMTNPPCGEPSYLEKVDTIAFQWFDIDLMLFLSNMIHCMSELHNNVFLEALLSDWLPNILGFYCGSKQMNGFKPPSTLILWLS